MMHTEYLLTETTALIENELYTVYGIRGEAADGTVISFPDVLSDKKAVETLVRLCNEGQLAIVHLPDVVMDITG